MVEFTTIPFILNEHSNRKKFYLYECLLLFIISVLIFFNLFYLKIYPFQTKLSIDLPSTSFTSSTSTRSNINSVKLYQELCNRKEQFNISRHLCERFICKIVVHSSGGRLGNRMFIFASAYGLARTHGCRLYVAHQIYDQLSSNFNMSMKKDFWFSPKDSNSIRDATIVKTVCRFLPDLLKPNAIQRIELQGYWQSYLFFDAYREEIRQMYSTGKDALIRLANYFGGIINPNCSNCSLPPHSTHEELRQAIRTNSNTIWIGIHIRLTDFRHLRYASNEDYILRAMLIYRKKFDKQKLRFLIASDDKTYCQKVYVLDQDYDDVIVLPEYFPPMDDLMALAFCHHSIVTGGTFSFWAAYLAGGEVIHDTAYPTACSSEDYYPSWFQLIGQPRQIAEKK